MRNILLTLLAVTSNARLMADEPRLAIDSGGPRALTRFLTFTHDGKSLVSAGDDKVVRIWDIASGKTVRTILGQVGDSQEGKIFAGALSPDQRYLALGGWMAPAPESPIRIHDFRSGEVVALLKGHKDVILTLAFSPDGRWLASGSADNTVKIWDTDGWKVSRTLTGFRNSVSAVAFSPDSSLLVSGSFDNTVKLWDRASGKLLRNMVGHNERVYSAAYSPDGRYIASGGADGVVKLWEGHSGAFIRDLAEQESTITRLEFSPDGQTLLTAGADTYICRILRVTSGGEVTRFVQNNNSVVSSAFSADGNLIATGGGDQNEILIWNPANASIVQWLVGNGSQIWGVGFSRDGRSIAFGTTKDFNRQNDKGPLENTIFLDRSLNLGITIAPSIQDPDSFMRAKERSGDFELRLKNDNPAVLEILQGARVKHEIVRGSGTGFRHDSFSLSPDGTLAASGGDGGALALYATNTGKASAVCVGHSSEVWAVAFALDGKTLVSGSGDQTVRVWDVAPSSCRNLLTIFVGSDHEWVAWTQQGYYTSSANGDKYIGWHVNRGLDHAAEFYQAAQFHNQFYRPDVIAAILSTRDIDTALEIANAARGIFTASPKVLGPADAVNHRPPIITVGEPQQEHVVVEDPALRVRAVASSPLPLTEFEVLVNGICQVGCGNGAHGRSQSDYLETDVVLQPGDNTVVFLAAHANASQSTRAFLATYRPRPGEGKRDRPKLIVLTVGVSAYENQQFRLDWAAKDAADVEEAFASQKGNRLYSDVLHHRIVNSEVTHQRILEELKWLNDQGDDDDIRLVFLSGHGGLDSEGNYYFYAADHDSTDLKNRDLPWQALLAGLALPNRKTVLLVDTCHAGAVAESPVAPLARSDVNFDEVLSETKAHFRGLFTLAASIGTELSWEKQEWQHGAFTKALLDALSTDSAGGEVLSTDDITQRVKERVKALMVDQHPTPIYSPSLNPFPLFLTRAQENRP